MKTLIILFLINLIGVKGHSAVSCTDKRTKEVCMGFSRYYHFNHINTILPSSDKNDTFYASRDRETLIQAGIEKICPEMNIPEYTVEYQMGQVRRGQRITIQHPPRGHSEQPSSNVWIYMNKNVNEYPRNKQPKNTSLELIGEYKFDNCYGIEKEISWANCTGTITIPKNIQNGIYTFVWRWDLNNIPYSDCFELDIK